MKYRLSQWIVLFCMKRILLDITLVLEFALKLALQAKRSLMASTEMKSILEVALEIQKNICDLRRTTLSIWHIVNPCKNSTACLASTFLSYYSSYYSKETAALFACFILSLPVMYTHFSLPQPIMIEFSVSLQRPNCSICQKFS